MKVEEVVAKVGANNYWSLFDFEEEFDEIGELECVASALNKGKHRWFQEATNVYKCEDGFVGVTGISLIFDEISNAEDYNCPCWACKYVPIQVTSYKPYVEGEF